MDRVSLPYSDEMGLIQPICPKCGNLLSTFDTTKCSKCKIKILSKDQERRFVDIKWN